MHNELGAFEGRSEPFPKSQDGSVSEATRLCEVGRKTDEVPLGTKFSFATFWDGDSLSAYEAACLESFVLRGYDVSLFTYGHIADVPEGITQRNAGDVVDRRYTKAYLINGKPSLSHFSDIFRYRLFKHDCDMIWIDSDMLLLRRFEHTLSRTIIAKEAQDSICGAIMRLENTEALDMLLERVETLAGKELRWGQTGPHLLTRTFGRDRMLHEAYEPKAFFPIHFAHFWKVFLPEHRAECEGMCSGSYTLHLWNNLGVSLGIWKDILPPEGSFLNGLFRNDRTDRHFRGTYPVDVMRQMVENWRMRYTGVGLSLGQVVRQLGPSVFVSAKKHISKHRA